LDGGHRRTLFSAGSRKPGRAPGGEASAKAGTRASVPVPKKRPPRPVENGAAAIASHWTAWARARGAGLRLDLTRAGRSTRAVSDDRTVPAVCPETPRPGKRREAVARNSGRGTVRQVPNCDHLTPRRRHPVVQRLRQRARSWTHLAIARRQRCTVRATPPIARRFLHLEKVQTGWAAGAPRRGRSSDRPIPCARDRCVSACEVGGRRPLTATPCGEGYAGGRTAALGLWGATESMTTSHSSRLRARALTLPLSRTRGPSASVSRSRRTRPFIYPNIERKFVNPGRNL